MAWQGSDRSGRLPKDWYGVFGIRRQVLAAAGWRCEHIREDNGLRCPQPATEADHIQPGDDHSLENLQALCVYHHARKSAREGNAAMRRKAAAKRVAPKHPGLL